MRPLEILTLLTIALATAALLLRDQPPSAAPLLLAGMAAALIAPQLLGRPFRWQLAPAWCVGAALLTALAFDMRPDGVARYVWAGAGLLICAASIVLASGMPVRTLPAPDGPFPVGVVATDLVRPADDGETARRLTVRLWYPAEKTGSSAPETLWPELHGAESPLAIRVLLHYLKGVRTHAWPDAPICARAGPRPLILYHHGLISIPSETALLMESLASHGYVAAAISYAQQMEEYRRLSSAVPSDERARDRRINAALRKAALDRARRADLMAEMYRNSTATAQIVRNRAADSVFVLDHIASALSRIPGCTDGQCVQTEQTGVLGFSLGGAVATRHCRIDERCVAAANMDGGLFGDPLTTPPAPYLMLYSAQNAGANDALASGGVVEDAVAPNSRHMDFHDATLMWPLLKWVGALGSINGADMVRWRNTRVRAFFDAHLKAAGSACEDRFRLYRQGGNGRTPRRNEPV